MLKLLCEGIPQCNLLVLSQSRPLVVVAVGVIGACAILFFALLLQIALALVTLLPYRPWLFRPLRLRAPVVMSSFLVFSVAVWCASLGHVLTAAVHARIACPVLSIGLHYIRPLILLGLSTFDYLEEYCQYCCVWVLTSHSIPGYFRHAGQFPEQGPHTKHSCF